MKMKIRKRKGITFFDFRTFPLFVLFIGSLIVLGQNATAFQNANPFGISYLLQGQQTNPFNFNGNQITPNLTNVTLSGGTTVTPQQSSNNNNQCSLPTWSWYYIPFTTVAGLAAYAGCSILTTLPAIISAITFSAIVSSGNPSNVNTGFTTILLMLMGVVLVSGIAIAGSGLNTASIFLAFELGGWLVLWILLSGLSYPLWYGSANSIPQPYGNLFFFFLTGLYAVGVIQKTL